jgi:hypothetical protein
MFSYAKKGRKIQLWAQTAAEVGGFIVPACLDGECKLKISSRLSHSTRS